VRENRSARKNLREWLAEAREELAKGKPAFAYTIGRELHWLDSDLYRKESAELLVAAYEAMGRRALAEITRAHVANRDLPSVGVFER
jgi:F0F1-type ATP synthase membrane subunit b/b'